MVETARPSPRPVLGVWALLCLVTNLPYARAWLLPPRGTRFLGFFYAIPDVFNYLSYVQQAEHGALLFFNKLYPLPHAASLANLEWSVVGWLSAALGSQPALAYRVFGAAVTLALVLATDRWLRLAGLPGDHRFAALLLVFTGGGLGGVLFLRLGPPAWRFLDLTSGMYPFISVLVNPHFAAGTALLLWALWAFHRARDLGGELLAVLLGSCLVLVRPYELALLVGIRGLVVLTTQPWRRWLRLLLPLAALAPAVLYGWSTTVRNPAYAVFSAVGYGLPPAADILLALLPAGVLALAGVPLLRGAHGLPERVAFATLLAWPVTVAAVLALPLRFGLQLAVDVGLPLLGLVALALARFRPAVTLAAALLLCSTSAVALELLLEDNPQWYVPRERIEAAEALRPLCRRGELLVAPPDIGLYANAYSACRAYAAHLGTADSRERAAAIRAFYAAPPAGRLAWLEARCARFVVLPDDGERAPHLLGAAAPYHRVAQASGPTGRLAVYASDEPPACPPGAPAAATPQ
ncbi:MAG TPA: hypothetical protein VMX54_15525 [Vicinamibacteria bacterium]|nr:hypothetical protein [Vicinamibacteria bacterium]